MVSTSARIAYLRRMLRRLDEDQDRVGRLLKAGELTPAGVTIVRELHRTERTKIMKELQDLLNRRPE